MVTQGADSLGTDDRQTLWARHQTEWVLGEIEERRSGLKAAVTQMQCDLCGARKKEKGGGGVGGDARKRGGKRTDRGGDTSPVCLMFGFPGVLQQ